MKTRIILSGIVLLSGVIAFQSCGDSGKPQRKIADPKDVELREQAKSFFATMPDSAFNAEQAKLGKKLYHETALSANGKLSCNSCHLLDKYGVDNLPTSPGHEGKNGERNSPTVYNAYTHFVQFWDGRAKDLAQQAEGPILNPVEMGLPTEQAAVDKIKGIADYAPMFAAAFPGESDPITYKNMTTAIGEFEKTLKTPAPFDKFLTGTYDALSTEQKEGLKLFIDKACIACHIGPALGGTMYQKFGLVQGPYWDYTKSTVQDKGRGAITKKAEDDYFFKVPSLRNIEKTGPYFHDGSVADLKESIRIMALTQSGLTLTPDEINKIAAFLNSLTGEIPADVLN